MGYYSTMRPIVKKKLMFKKAKVEIEETCRWLQCL